LLEYISFKGFAYELLVFFDFVEFSFTTEQTPQVRPSTQYLQKLQVVQAVQFILPIHLLVSGFSQQVLFLELNRSPKGITNINSRNSLDMILCIVNKRVGES
jgi:hypothetical protein